MIDPRDDPVRDIQSAILNLMWIHDTRYVRVRNQRDGRDSRVEDRAPDLGKDRSKGGRVAASS